MLPVPDLPAGSWLAPPPKAYSIAIRGTVASCTNQASMPPGDTSRWILAAACDGVEAIIVSATQATTTDTKRCAPVVNRVTRSEERRVGKECRSRCAPYH